MHISSLPKNGNKANTSGFTLVELLVVMAVTGLFATVLHNTVADLRQASDNNNRHIAVRTCNTHNDVRTA